MKTLERFWHWYRNERPAADATRKMRAKHLSPLAEHALALAAEQITARGTKLITTQAADDALADLSLAFCRALEAMHAVVPEAPGRARATLLAYKPPRVPSILDQTSEHLQRYGEAAAWRLLDGVELPQYFPANIGQLTPVRRTSHQ